MSWLCVFSGGCSRSNMSSGCVQCGVELHLLAAQTVITHTGLHASKPTKSLPHTCPVSHTHKMWSYLLHAWNRSLKKCSQTCILKIRQRNKDTHKQLTCFQTHLHALMHTQAAQPFLAWRPGYERYPPPTAHNILQYAS